jgi:hypothetical protein
MVRKFRESLPPLQKDDRPTSTIVGDFKNIDHPAAGKGSWGLPVSTENALGHPVEARTVQRTGLRRQSEGSRREDLDGRSPRAARTVGRPEFREYLPPPNEVPMAEFREPLADDPAASETPTSGNPSHPRNSENHCPPPI